MTDNAQHADLKRMWSGWISLVLFVLLIPLSNWVIVNLGVVCPPGEPCLVPVLPGLWAPSTGWLAGFSLVLRTSLSGLALGVGFHLFRSGALGFYFRAFARGCIGERFPFCGIG